MSKQERLSVEPGLCRKLILTVIFALSIAVCSPEKAMACVFCLEHMGMDASMFWSSDIMLSFRLNYSDIWVAGNQVQSGYSHTGGSQDLLTQENTLQALVTKKWMVQVTEPFYYRWNSNPQASSSNTYTPGLGNNNSGFLAIPGDLWIANLLDIYDRSTFSGTTRVVLVQGVHFPTSPTNQSFNNQNITSTLTGAGAYELTFGIEAMHTFSNGRWMTIGDAIYSFELPNNLGTQLGNTLNTDYQVEYRLTGLHSQFPEIWISAGDYIQYNSSNIQINPYVQNGVLQPAGPIQGSENFQDSVGMGFQIMPKSVPSLMIFGNADKFVYWSQPGTTPSAPALNPDFKVLTGFMWMF